MARSRRSVANWLERAPELGPLTPASLAALIGLVESGAISGDAGRKVLELLVAEGGEPGGDRGARGPRRRWATSSPTIVDKVLADNPDVVERIRGGNPKAIGALMGPIMRETKGRADGGEVQTLIREQLGELVVSTVGRRERTMGYGQADPHGQDRPHAHRRVDR